MNTINNLNPKSFSGSGLHLYSSTMINLFINTVSKRKQYFLSVAMVCLVSVICYALPGYIGYKFVAFILLVTVSLLAMSFDILPVFVAALLSALIWDFFFIPPHFTLHVTSGEDAILLLMYFVIAMVNAVLTYKIRQVEKLARAKEEKAHTVKLYNTLLNSLSHELRTPIAAIIGATDNLLMNDLRLTPHHKNELLGVISKAAFRLNQQVENLLNMSRLESGFIQPKKDWCDISEVVYSVVKRLEDNNIQQSLNINISHGIPLVKSDKGMLEQIIYNLVNNASQYTEPGSTISITALCDNDVLKLIIADDGKGFPTEEINKVFEKFYRVNHSKTGGTGLGLSIVKGFTEALKGKVSLENISTGGAKFTIQIPAETSYLKA
jgi:two-component system sensor histidine kinase KdpD